MAYAKIGDTPRVFPLICLGDDFNASRHAADAVDSVLIAARNAPLTGSWITYVEQDESESGPPDTWKVTAGIFRRTNAWRPAGLVDGILTLHLTKV